VVVLHPQDIAHARLEFEITCFGAIQDLLTKTGEGAACYHFHLKQT
jgi:hypothetical protein